MRVVSVLFILVACVLIALGRWHVRAGRRGAGGHRRKRVMGWGLVGLGFMAMILGVLLW